MKIAKVGSRNVNAVIDCGGKATQIISGGAKGVDTQAREYAAANGIDFLEIPPDYKKYGRGAPFIRNRQIVDAADFVLAYWNGKSKGTKYTIDYAANMGKPYQIIFCETIQ